MWDLVEILLGGVGEIVAEVLGFLRGWRFFVCIGAGALIIALIYSALESDDLSLAIAVPVALLMFTTGLIWDIRNG